MLTDEGSESRRSAERCSELGSTDSTQEADQSGDFRRTFRLGTSLRKVQSWKGTRYVEKYISEVLDSLYQRNIQMLRIHRVYSTFETILVSFQFLKYFTIEVSLVRKILVTLMKLKGENANVIKQ